MLLNAFSRVVVGPIVTFLGLLRDNTILYVLSGGVAFDLSPCYGARAFREQAFPTIFPIGPHRVGAPRVYLQGVLVATRQLAGP